jgi:outer membrane protein assembly factor BamD (BamD/ComL family)
MRHLPALLLTLATASSLQAQETLKFREPARNPDVEGDIVSLSYRTVEIVTGGVKQPIDARRVVEIVPAASRKTADFAKGEEAMTNGSFAAAIERFERVATDARAPESLKQIASIQSVRCAAANGDDTGVVQAAQVLRARKPDHFFLRESYEREVHAHLALGNGAGAAAAIQAFGALATANGFSEWAKSVDLLQAAVAENQNNWRGALLIFRKYLKDADIGEIAALGEMRTLTALADWTALAPVADAHLKEAMGRRDCSPRILIASNTAKGDVDAGGGKLKDALLNYLQGAMVLNKGTPNPEHETAVARSSLTCSKLCAAERDRARRARYLAQAEEMKGELLKSYPRSRFKAEVEKAIRDLR